MSEALVVDGLTLETDAGRVLVDHAAFSVAPGEVLALVGESGSGKTTLALALLGFLRRGVECTAGTVRIGDTEVWGRPDAERRVLRGREISYVPQDPATQLNPAHTVGRQLDEAIARREEPTEARKLELLESVGLPAVARILKSYPFELSGGQQQRIAIAMALAARPRVVVLDEPTTGLDVTTQQRILRLLRGLATTSDSAFVYITHDLGAVRELADRVVVMREGKLIEEGEADAVLGRPQEPYTRLLVASAPSREGIRLYRGAEDLGQAELLRPPPSAQSSAAPLLQARDVQVTYGGRGRKAGQVVLQNLDLEVAAGETIAIVGESGSGKSTFVRAACGLAPVTRGEFLLDGTPLPRSVRHRDLEQLRSVQMVYQNPDRSLNPMETVWAAIERSVRSFRQGTSAAERRVLIEDALDRVHLSRGHARKYPYELSGGEKQRVAIARALVGLPKVLVCDEVTSALDASTQAVIIALLGELNAQGLTLLYVTHDLGAVRSVAHRIAVLRGGGICELGDSDQVLDHPTHEYTQELLDATAFVA